MILLLRDRENRSAAAGTYVLQLHCYTTSTTVTVGQLLCSRVGSYYVVFTNPITL